MSTTPTFKVRQQSKRAALFERAGAEFNSHAGVGGLPGALGQQSALAQEPSSVAAKK